MDKDFNENCGCVSGHKFYNDTVSAIDFVNELEKVDIDFLKSKFSIL